MSYQKDSYGNDYIAPGPDPVGHGTQIKIPTGNGGTVDGTMVHGNATPNSK